MGILIALGLLAVAVGLFWAGKKGWISNESLQRMTNVAGIVSLLAAILAFVLLPTGQGESPAPTSQPTSLPGIAVTEPVERNTPPAQLSATLDCPAVNVVPIDNIGGEILNTSHTGPILRLEFRLDNAGETEPQMTRLLGFSELYDEATGERLKWSGASAVPFDTLAPGQSREGWLEFEVPPGNAPRCVKLILQNRTIFEHIPVPK